LDSNIGATGGLSRTAIGTSWVRSGISIIEDLVIVGSNMLRRAVHNIKIQPLGLVLVLVIYDSQ
jgi:hypothetical protein